MKQNNKTCTNCVLHTGIPGITIDDDGLCSLCTHHKKFNAHEPRLRKYLTEEMENLFKKARSKKRPYHAIVLFSGGKDSTVLLKLAKEKYRLRTLAVSVMHPLVNDTAQHNIENVAAKLGVDLVKIYPDVEVYKKAIRMGILEGPKYGLSEFFGCDVCSFFHSWLPINYAMKMDIPVILEGSDLSQTGDPHFLQSERVSEEAKKGKKPYGGVHDLMMDAIGEEYKGSIYDYDVEEVTGGRYPSIVSPFTFLPYDYRENFKEIESMGLPSKSFRTIYTNCSATPFFSYFSMKRFGCVSYIKHYATEVRRGYPNLMQRSVKDTDTANVLTREVVEAMMDEYKNVVLYVAENKMTRETMTDAQKEKAIKMAPTYMEIFGREVCDIFLQDVLEIPKYAEFFGVDLADVK